MFELEYDKYNSEINPFKRIALHSAYLCINHPVTNKKMIFESKAPTEFFNYAKNNFQNWRNFTAISEI